MLRQGWLRDASSLLSDRCRVKRTGREADRLSTYGEFMRVELLLQPPPPSVPHVFMAWCLTSTGDNFTFTLLIREASHYGVISVTFKILYKTEVNLSLSLVTNWEVICVGITCNSSVHHQWVLPYGVSNTSIKIARLKSFWSEQAADCRLPIPREGNKVNFSSNPEIYLHAVSFRGPVDGVRKQI